MDSKLIRGKYLADMNLRKGDTVKCVQAAFPYHRAGDICEVGKGVMADSRVGLWVHTEDEFDFEQGKVRLWTPE